MQSKILKTEKKDLICEILTEIPNEKILLLPKLSLLKKIVRTQNKELNFILNDKSDIPDFLKKN